MSFDSFLHFISRTTGLSPDEVSKVSEVTPDGYRAHLAGFLIAASPASRAVWGHKEDGNGRFDLRSGYKLGYV